MMKRSGFYTVFLTGLGWMGLAGSASGLFAALLPRKDKEEAEWEIIRAAEISRNPLLVEPDDAYFKVETDWFRGLLDGSLNPADGKAAEPKIDWSWATPFQRRVLEQVRKIPPGTVLTYSQVAALIGAPQSARAVGGALRANRLPLIIPCHRVVAAGGRLGGFSGGGPSMKSLLLELENKKRS